ncbi:phosphatidylglycerol lysyltransferase domain-containing protein [Rhodovulum sp. DZ06]|uniref:phosphatidylglycerol lysyltransferase domain-containing protein n=1 Tax=Rhodovulum sp. DZ06 TaxID=3425126 RepID=UPI003D34B21C
MGYAASRGIAQDGLQVCGSGDDINHIGSDGIAAAELSAWSEDLARECAEAARATEQAAWDADRNADRNADRDAARAGAGAVAALAGAMDAVQPGAVPARLRLPAGLRSNAGRALAAAAACLGGLWLARERLAEVDGDAFLAALGGVAPWAMALACVAGLLSHLAAAGYDAQAMKRLGRAMPVGDSLRGGFAAVAISQALGLGLLTGTAARWRMHRGAGMGAGECAALSGAVSLGFYMGLAVLAGLAALLAPGMLSAATGASEGDLRAAALLGFAAALGAGIALRRAPALHVGGRRLTLPDGGWLLGAAALTAADLVPAALCFWLLLPNPPGFAEFAVVYAAAIALALATGAPGGVGAFEAVMLAAFPSQPAAEMAAALLLYRAAFHGPAVLVGLRLLARAPKAAPAKADAALRARISAVLEAAERAEAALVLSGDKHVVFDPTGRAFAMYGVIGGWRVMLGDPHGPREAWDGAWAAMQAGAAAEKRRVAVYKAEDADFWARHGMALQPLGEEALVDAAGFTLDGPERRELRRKLAKAKKAGVEVTLHAPGAVPLDDLRPVARAWAAARGGERRFSMGAWDPAFLARHHVVVARVGGAAVAFLSLWRSGSGAEWSVDLMRQLPEIPDGAMHALIAAGIGAARDAGAERFNLCMAPLSGLDEAGGPFSKALGAFYARSKAGKGLQGLRRFKEGFRPDWSVRWLATPRRRDMPGALWAATRLVHGAAQSVPAPELAPRAPEAAMPGATGFALMRGEGAGDRAARRRLAALLSGRVPAGAMRAAVSAAPRLRARARPVAREGGAAAPLRRALLRRVGRG